MNIVFDIGGTNMRVAAARDGELGEIKKVPTPADPKEGVAVFAQIARELSGGSVGVVVGGVPGSVASDGSLYDAPNVSEWQKVNITKELSDALGVPVRIFNDTVIAGYGEKMHGAGRGFSKVAYLTVSTGVGGACINESNPAESTLLGGDLWELKQSLGAQISGTAVQKKFGIHPKDLDSLDERNKLADILAAALVEIAEKWKPDVFVIGGSMIVGVNPIPLERVREKFTAVPVKMAELGDNGGLIGGAILASQ